MVSNLLQLQAVFHAYHDRTVMQGVSFDLGSTEIGCLLGPSGGGKTTVLRCIAGLEDITAGEIRLGDAVVSRAGYTAPPQSRRIGMVFQEYALFPHLSVAGNIAFGLAGMTAAAKRDRIDELLAVVGLTGMGERYPHELSGGQQQRVALARALAPRPQLLLLDEPFSNLDVALRERLSGEVRDILKAQATAALVVTHDQHEAFALADRIGILHDGCLQQWDTPYNLYHEPANRFVADFVGQGVFVAGQVLAPDRLQIELGEVPGNMPHDCCLGCTADVLIRPDDIIHDDHSPIQARVLAKTFRGAEFLYTLQLPSGTEVLSLVPSHHDHAIGEWIGIRLEIDHVIAFRR